MKTKKLIEIENLPVMEELSMNKLDNVVGGTDIDPITCHAVRFLEYESAVLPSSMSILSGNVVESPQVKV